MTNLIPTQPRQPVSEITTRKIVEGFALADRSPPTQNELAWIEMLRAIVGDRNPRPTLAAIQALQRALLPE